MIVESSRIISFLLIITYIIVDEEVLKTLDFWILKFWILRDNIF